MDSGSSPRWRVWSALAAVCLIWGSASLVVARPWPAASGVLIGLVGVAIMLASGCHTGAAFDVWYALTLSILVGGAFIISAATIVIAAESRQARSRAGPP
ncbi:MAG: hypothetical protein H0T54_08045 [Geodermatophilaceae bacterium]|nr:hypothetical protein [Geodermatophilaceae bacterium]